MSAKPWLSWTTASLWIAVAAATMIGAAFVSYVGSVSAPFADEWRFTNPQQYLPSLFVRHTDHPFVIGRLALALDYYLFDARGWALRSASYLVIAGQALAVFLLARAAGLRDRTDLIAITAFAIAVAYNPQGSQNLIWGFQFPFSFAFASAALAFASLAAYASTSNRSMLALACVMGFLATLSLSNGLLAPPLLLILAWRLKLPRAVLVRFALLTVGTLAIFVAMPASRANPLPIRLSDWSDMAQFALRILGSSFAETIDSIATTAGTQVDTLGIALVVGVFLTLLTASFSWLALNEKNPSPARLGALAIAAFAILTAASIGVGRSFMGQAFSQSSRYTVVGALLTLAVGAFAATYAERLTRVSRQCAFLIIALCCVCIPLGTFAVARTAAQYQRVLVTSQTSYVAGTAAEVAGRPLGGIMADLPFAIAASDDLRAHGKWMFADRWSRSLQTHVDVPRGVEDCEGSIVSRRVAEDVIALDGSIQPRAPGRIIVVLNQDGLMVGYGLVPHRVSDFLGLSAYQRNPLDWVGYAKIASTGELRSLTAYAASNERLFCRLGQQNSGVSP